MAIKAKILCSLTALAASSSASAQFTFVDVTSAAALTYPLETGSPGVAVVDFDEDGWMDICISGAKRYTPQLFRNSAGAAGQRYFTRVTTNYMPNGAGPSSLSMFADLDGDGDQDIVDVARFRTIAAPEGDNRVTGVRFFERTPTGFVKRSSPSRLAAFRQKIGGLSLGDMDLDGDLDIIFMHNGGMMESGGPGFYLRNEGGFNFTDQTALFGAGLGNTNRYFTTLINDFNRDGWPDLHIAVDFHTDFHAWNNQDGTFTDVSAQVGTTNQGSDMGACLGDIDNDGDMDIFSTNGGYGVLYVNDGTGHFTEEGQTRGCGAWGGGFAIGWGTLFSDFDLDGDQDLIFVAYGDVSGQIFENDGTGHFTRQADDAGMGLRGHGLVTIDYDKDGDQDLFVMRTGAMFPKLYENTGADSSGYHSITIDLRGTTSNPDGVGARVEVHTGSTVQHRVMMCGYSFKSAPATEVHFGLNTATIIDQLIVRWPSGTVQTLTAVPVDQFLTITEQ